MVEVTGVVRAPVTEVFDGIAGRLRSPGWEADRERGLVARQGGWWYRGEYLVAEDPAGTRVTHRVYNVASRGRWAVPLANRLFIGFRARVRTGFAELLRELDDSRRG
ncbi:hypothetical protein [Amycolatopsis sp. H20-H5]|uniref:hypothetical protein n=1 Tax=Amycolatopsis sp. H20-H5 TaxID=3046309 RepID=UPI002DBFB614|nr:hypothetical protein [Amycolatopsis sp. H20-H5]MEC3977236.1 hypothetical protein [Amycolatopsis sp. H20-H5]